MITKWYIERTNHGNADGLSQKPSTEGDIAEGADGDKKVPTETDVRVIHKQRVGEALRQQQREDLNFEKIVKMPLADEVPTRNKDLQTESELTKKIVVRWEDLGYMTEWFAAGRRVRGWRTKL